MRVCDAMRKCDAMRECDAMRVYNVMLAVCECVVSLERAVLVIALSPCCSHVVNSEGCHSTLIASAIAVRAARVAG